VLSSVYIHNCCRVLTQQAEERDLPGRECGITASPALRVIGRSHRAGDAKYNNGRNAQDRAFAVAAPRAWNSLPDAIRRSSSLTVFKRSLKTHFYIQSFY